MSAPHLCPIPGDSPIRGTVESEGQSNPRDSRIRGTVESEGQGPLPVLTCRDQRGYRSDLGEARDDLMSEKADPGQRWGWLDRRKRAMYAGGRPGLLARVMNRISAAQFSAGVLSPRRAVTLEVRGRRTGRVISCPLVVTDYEGERYLVAMLGNGTNW